MKAFLHLILSCTLLSVTGSVKAADTCEVRKLETTRMADLNIPRAGHQVFYAGGELMVAGGHTDGFVPTPTAEYYADGKWHQLSMTYNHDFGISVMLKSGKVLLAGGCEQPTGIGQTYTAEFYDPLTRTFRGFGNMNVKRVWASALELNNGQVVIAGNWYHADGIELFHEKQSHVGDNKDKQSFEYIKDVTTERSLPYIFQMADGDALILGSIGTRGDTLRCTFADRLKGDTVHIPLFETWQPLVTGMHHDEASLISDDFTYLLPVQDSTGQVAIAQVQSVVGDLQSPTITLYPTACDIPMAYQGDQIEYFSNIIVDRQASRAYLAGINRCFHATPEKARYYVLSIDYAQASEGNAAPMMLYYTDPLNATPDCAPLLTPEGNLLFAGGLSDNSNYTPSAAVWLLCLGTTLPNSSGFDMNGVLWIGLAVVGLIVLAVLLLTVLRRNHGDWHNDSSAADIRVPVPVIPPDDILMQRITCLMEEQELYLDSELKLSDVASSLGSNRNAISNCINSQRGCSFTQFVNKYRIDYAQRLLRTRSDIKISEVWTTSGFSTERTFLRTFKQLTGMTPSEFKTKID